jgi:3-oxoacyl-(acyl-carrier-protein) synthase
VSRGSQATIVATVASAHLPADLLVRARASGAGRQVTRFLDGMALPAFVAGISALDAAGVADGERCGLFTVSGWDPDPQQPELDGDEGGDAATATYRTVARHYITTASPMSWLPKMVNNALCQLSMTRGLRGPNNHVVGGRGALAAVLLLGRRAIESGAADHVLIVAYDAPVGQESDFEVEGQAAALVLGTGADGTVVSGAAGSVGTVGEGRDRAVGGRGDRGSGASGDRAVDALDELIAALPLPAGVTRGG